MCTGAHLANGYVESAHDLDLYAAAVGQRLGWTACFAFWAKLATRLEERRDGLEGDLEIRQWLLGHHVGHINTTLNLKHW